jgi:uncharacterized protein YjbI with pentapeptide repeats
MTEPEPPPGSRPTSPDLADSPPVMQTASLVAPLDSPRPPQKSVDKANEFDAARKSVEDAAAVAAGLWLSYIFVFLYIGIATGGVSHLDLLLESTVGLPFLSGVELPLVAFFVLAPLIFLITHVYTLVHFVMLAAKSKTFDDAISARFPHDSSAVEVLRLQLPSNIFVQLLAGPEHVRLGGLGRILQFIAWSTLVGGPILLLLMIQAQFIPFHHQGITWWHRSVVLIDILMLWLLWPAVLEGSGMILRPSMWRYKLASLASPMVLGFAFVIVTFPGEPLQEWINGWRLGGALTWTHDVFFQGEIDQTLRLRKGWFSDTLVLSNANAQKLEFDAVREALSLRGRHLERAVFLAVDLRHVDFTGAHLEGAQLAGAKLQGSILDKASLQGAKLDWGHLEGAHLNFAHLEGVYLEHAWLQGASLFNAELQGATLSDTKLQGATLDKAVLMGASMDGARLDGASLKEVQLQGASLANAVAKAAVLKGANLWRAHLDPKAFTEIQGAAVIEPLTQTNYAKLVDTIMSQVPPVPIEEDEPKRNLRDLALDRIANLDPARVFGGEEQTPAWLKQIKTISDAAYQMALASQLKIMLCSVDAEQPYFVEGLLNNYRIADTGNQIPRLVKAILESDCTAQALTIADKAKLQGLPEIR